MPEASSVQAPPIKAKRLAILGTRGLPSAHSGFESFVAQLAPYLVERGWDVAVYCQDEGAGGPSAWRGVGLVQIPVARPGSLGSILFDAKAVWRAAHDDRLVLIMGYNTAILGIIFKLVGRKHLYNMDGLEWLRAKWSLPVRVWFYANEWLACLIGDHLIADHPEIARHLSSRFAARKTSMIPYCAEPATAAEPSHLAALGLEPDRYALVICRPEPENSVLEIVRAFSMRRRGHKLLVLGRYRPEDIAYHRAVIDAASAEVIFPGAIFDPAIVGALRRFARVYVHGHQVGGTNPSLVEALAAPTPVLARDNKFNRWVAGPDAKYFSDEADCAACFDRVFAAPPDELADARCRSAERHAAVFEPAVILGSYERVLERWIP